ncbi:acyl-CoA thioester hydrolase [Algoriphagus sp. 4150]|uniref:acyl-CoA thioesterase n=1 Tax=Algoriphagus sp. 4150 TaxID=2817756 RepID=UPI00285E8279|nr:acyl-CoA thioesterase [Algoriphagus sp. 4150]MDR7131470.1 acyl-CoA thioester hydrolase [Algoriphagus sp. 4150]
MAEQLNGTLDQSLMSTLPMEKLPESKSVIRFQDCDPFNHLNNSRYIDYFINAREDHLLRFYGFDIFKIVRETGMGWVVGQHQISFIRPVALMETVRIKTRLLSYSKHSILIESLMLDTENEGIRSLLWTQYFYYDLKKKSVSAHDKEYLEFFEKIHFPHQGELSFERRNLEIRNAEVTKS